MLYSMFTPTSLLVSAFLAALLYGLYRYYVFLKLYENIPTIKVHPFITYGQNLVRAYKSDSPRAFILRTLSAVCKVYSEFPLVSLWVGIRPFIFIIKPEAAEVVLNSSKAISKSLEYKFLEPWLGTGLLTSTGNKWRTHRKLLTSTFHFQILDNFITTFSEEAAVLTKKLEAAVEKPWIDIVPVITMFTLDTICQTAMGVQMNIQSGCCKEYVETLDEISDAFIYRVFRPWLWMDPIFFYCSPAGWKFRKNLKCLHDFTRKVIKEKKESVLKQDTEKKSEMGKPKKKALLELLIEAHLEDSTFTEENIREEVDTFMFEGHDTTAMSISWTLYELGRHSEIQEKVFEELDSIFGSDKDRNVTQDDLKQMKYLECTIKESLRLYPSVFVIARQLSDTIHIGEYTLEPGCTCCIVIMALHRDPEHFPRPEIFDPDRFLPENCIKRHPYAYIPFSAGSRNCIGQRFALMEEKTALAHILRKFKVTALDPPDKIQTMVGLILKNVEPLRISLTPREKMEAS